MDENEILTPEEQEFSLEDIMREFGSGNYDDTIHDDAAPEHMEDIPQRELLEDAPVADHLRAADEPEVLTWTPRTAETRDPDKMDVSMYDTRAFAPVTAVSSGDTQRIDSARILEKVSAGGISDDTQRFTPVGESAAGNAEPFSENWEPEYDQPIGEYTPPEPIIFRPKSRLGELKRKLMDGPEQRYYALSERGVGKLQIALFVSMLIVVMAVASIVLHRLDMVQENRMRLLVFGELFAMLVSALLCWERLADGFGNLFKVRFNADTLLAFSFIACIADGIFCLKAVKVPFCAAFCLETLMLLWSEYQQRSTELCQMDTLRKAIRLNRVTRADNCYEGRPGFCVAEGEPEDFMDHYQTVTGPQKALDRFALIALIASAVVALAAGIMLGPEAGIHTWSAAILAAYPATALISQTRPAWTLQRRLYRFGSVLCGWKGVKASGGRAAVPLSDEDLLPGGSVKINGVKFYSGRNPDTIIGYATAVMTRSGSCLAPLFEHMHQSRRGQTFEIDEFKTYGDQGVGAIICGESVLMGSQEFLKRMGVDVPVGTRVNQAVYISIDSEFCCVFALAYGKLKGVSAGLSALCSQRRLTPVLATANFLLDESFLRSRYNVDTRRIAIPEAAEREKLAAWQPDTGETVALTTQEGLTGAAFAITGARSLRIASVAGAVVHILGGVVGLASVLLLTMAGRVDLLTPANLLLLELIWAVPGLMFSEWTRNI